MTRARNRVGSAASGGIRRALLLVACATAGVGTAEAQGRLDYRGVVLGSRPVNAMAARALAAPRDTTATLRLLEDVVGRLQADGYLDARATATWDSAARPTLTLEVREGVRYRLESVAIRTPSSADSARIAAVLRLRPGQAASPQVVGHEIERAVREVADHGHPYAVLGVGGWQADSGRVRLALSGGLGPQVTISRVRLEGLRVTQARLVEKSMGPLAGLPYSRAAAEAARARAEQLGLFGNVTLEGLEGERDWSRGELVYRLVERRYNSIEGAVGVQGEAGMVGRVRLDLDNILGTGRAVGLGWESRGKGVAHFGGRYAEPLLFGTPLRLEGMFDQQVQDTLFVRTRWGARALYALSGQERIEGGYEQERVVQEEDVVEEASIQSTVFALERTTLEYGLGPRRGSRVRVAAAQSFKSERLEAGGGERSARASAVELRGEWHRSIGARSGFALELSGAGRFSSERVLPVYERYPLGGATTLRGFDEEAFRVDRFALSRFEWRWFLSPGGERAFVFWDHARTGTRVPVPAGGDQFEVRDHDGVGFGLRLVAAGALVGIDYGLEPGRPPLEGKIHLQLISTF